MLRLDGIPSIQGHDETWTLDDFGGRSVGELSSIESGFTTREDMNKTQVGAMGQRAIV